jgi:phenylacetate-CoA ligase
MDQGPERELFDPQRQAGDQDTCARWASDGLAREWDRLWSSGLEFYCRKYQAAGLTRRDLPDLAAIPLTTKAELRADEATFPPFGSYRSVGREAARFISTSSGATGRPQIHLRTALDQERWIESMRRHWWRAGLRAGDRLAQTWPPPPYSPPWALTLAPAEILEIPSGPPAAGGASPDQLSLWQALRPTAFMTTSSQLQLYEAAAGQLGIDLRALTEGTSVSIIEAACQFPEPAAWFADHYGFARVHNLSGASEVPGFIGSSCRFNTGIHQSADLVIVEVVDPSTGEEVGCGERGHLVVSAIGHDQFWLRYDLEDIVVRSDGPCPCGETGPRYTLIGRQADAVEVGGRTVLPLDVQLALFGQGAPEFRVAGTESGSLRVEIETDRPEGGTALEQCLIEHLEIPVTVTPVTPGTLPRSIFKPRHKG